MHHRAIGVFILLWMRIHAFYNPIPIGSVIVTTRNRIAVVQPKEYGGTDAPRTIYTAVNMTIIYSVYDPSGRDIYIIYTRSSTNDTVYLSELVSIEQLDSNVYELPITFDITQINQFNSFSSDIGSRRVFLTDPTGNVTVFSMAGLLKTNLPLPNTIAAPIRSAAYNDYLNRFFFINDANVYSCAHSMTDAFQCCGAQSAGGALRSIAFEQIGGDTYVYVLDQKTGIYAVPLDAMGCPRPLRLLNMVQNNINLQFVVDRGLYFESGSEQSQTENSNLYIGNGTDSRARMIPIGSTIVALAVSIPNARVTFSNDGTCFHGVSHSTYRAAVILAAIFGTIMGILMCFNVLFCIDFFMTKRIIRDLKQQIPHNLLEDRWNKLIEEKYAKIALERKYLFIFFFFFFFISLVSYLGERKKDDPPPRRKSSVNFRSSSATASNTDNRGAGGLTTDSLQVPNPLPKISDYIRRKSENYFIRRRSDDPRSQRHQTGEEFTDIRTNPARQQLTTAQASIAPVKEENENSRQLRQNLSRRELLKDDDFL